MIITYAQAKESAVQQIEQSFQGCDNFIDANPYRQKLMTMLDRWVCVEDIFSVSNLPLLTCEANGGTPKQAVPILATWQLTRFAVKLFDDVEDGDITCQQAQAINAAMGLLSTAQLVLADMPSYNANWCRVFNKMLLRAGAGQHVDLGASTTLTPEQWLTIAKAKSGEFLGWAAWAGAAVTKVEQQNLMHYWSYGCCLGVLLQIADDFGGIWNPDDNSDLATGAFSLPVCYGLTVTKGETYNHLIQLLVQAKAGEVEAKQEIRQFLVDLGAQAYLLAVAQMIYQQAVTAIERCGLSVSERSKFVALLKETMPGLLLIDQVSYAEMDQMQHPRH